jgi:hypothetical protein
MRFAMLIALGLLALVACGPVGDSEDDGSRTIFVGALEDLVKQPTPAEARKRVEHATTAGFDAIGVTTPWAPGQVDPDPGQLLILKNLADAAEAKQVRVLVSIFQYRNRDTPLSDEEQQQFADYAARLARELPSIRDFVIGNEPNLNGFWFPQFDESGRSAAAPAYTSLLALSYDALKAVSPEINVIGGALAPRGADNPESPRHTQSPTVFIRDMGAAYRASGREEPLMDIFAIHPYLERSAIAPSTEHPAGTSIGIADYEKLVGLLEEAFDGTAQKGGDLPIAYTEFGVQAEIPENKQKQYENLTSPLGVDAVDEETQARYYREALELASCQETVIGVLLFHLYDEPDLDRWQSGMYYVDSTPKSSLAAVREAAIATREGKLECPDD